MDMSDEKKPKEGEKKINNKESYPASGAVKL